MQSEEENKSLNNEVIPQGGQLPDISESGEDDADAFVP